MMFKTGLVSVTFRPLSCEEIIAAVAAAKLDGIEWGGDVHVPAGDYHRAEEVGRLTREAGLAVFSYGSYYKLPDTADTLAEFEKNAKTAVALGAPSIRIWAGNLGSAQADAAYRQSIAARTRAVCDIAKKYSLQVCFEYHRGSLTDNSKTAVELMKAAGCNNLHLYWQPNPELTDKENAAELCDVLPYVVTAHIFHWTDGNTQLPLADGASLWLERMRVLRAANPDCAFLMEFVQDGSLENFRRDAETLKQLTAKAQAV